LARLNPIAILSGIGFAVFLQYAPTIASGILTATV
jgi:conjugal transfer pilus assembly protein TraA